MAFQFLSLLVALALVLGGCSRHDERQAPVDALLAFVSAIERSTSEPEYREQAYAHVDAASRAVLEQRAELARSLAGRELEGWEMLVPGRVRVTSRALRREGLRARIEGDRASISLGEGEPLLLVREEGRWRLHLFDEPAPDP